MLLDRITNIDIDKESITIELVGVVGFEINSEDLANKINEAKSNGIKNVKVILESPGGDMGQGLAIYSILKNSGLKVESYLRGANASASTLIASSANKENIYMDGTGLYLIHKPMTVSQGNEQDLEQSKNSLKKWENSARKIYENLGVSNKVIEDLMNRNSGHGEWLTFEEAKEYGFVSNEWVTESVYNYDNEKIFTINNLITPKKISMEDTKKEVANEEKSLLTKIWDKINSEPETKKPVENKTDVKNELTDEEKTSVVDEVMQILEPRLVALEEAMAEMKPAEEMEEEEVEDKEEDEKYNNLLAEFKNLKKEISGAKVENKKTTFDPNAPRWKQILNAHKNIN